MTIAPFVERHEEATAGLCLDALTLLCGSGLVKVGVIAVDCTNLQANASRNENLEYLFKVRALAAADPAVLIDAAAPVIEYHLTCDLAEPPTSG